MKIQLTANTAFGSKLAFYPGYRLSVCIFEFFCVHIFRKLVLEISYSHMSSKVFCLFFVNSYILHSSKVEISTPFKHMVQWFLFYSQICATLTAIEFQNLLQPQKNTSHSPAVTSPLPAPCFTVESQP